MTSPSFPSATAALPSPSAPVRAHDLHSAVLQDVSVRRFDGLLQRYRAGLSGPDAADGLNRSVEHEGGYAQPLLHLMVENGRVKLLARLLREPGLDLDVQDGEDHDGDPALFLATYSSGHPSPNPVIVALLLDAGARADGTTMLGLAPHRATATLVQALLWMPTTSTPSTLDVLHERGLIPVAGLDAPHSGLLHSMLDHARLGRVLKGSPAPAIEWLIAHGADPHRCNADGLTVAARLNHGDPGQDLDPDHRTAMLQVIERRVLGDTARQSAGPNEDPSGSRPGPSRGRPRL